MEQTILTLSVSERTSRKLTEEQKEINRDRGANINNYLRLNKNIYCNGSGNDKKVSLTFDDAPDAYCTPRILDILKLYQIKAGFSTIGLHIDECRGMLKRIYQEGHTIVNHTYMHFDLSTLSNKKIYDEVKRTEDLIYELIGVKPLFVRPPYGSLSAESVRELERHQYGILLWSYDTCDWLATSKDDITENMLDTIRPGEIILFHSYENKEPTVSALEPIILGLRSRGFEFVPLEELLHVECYQKIEKGEAADE